jgi:hypothetical protein
VGEEESEVEVGAAFHENGRGLSLGLTMVRHTVVVGPQALQLLKVVVVVG